MKIVATVEARMTSTRLPGKVLLPLAGKPVLEHLVNRVRKSKYIDETVVATTVNDTDNPIVEHCNKINTKYYRGSENNVLDRVLNAARSCSADIIVELMGDSPFIDPVIIDQAITSHLSGTYDYTSNFLFENTYPMGFAVQVFPIKVLERVALLTNDPIDLVHVSCYIYHNPKIFKLNKITANPEVAASEIFLSLDTKNDYELICKVFEPLFLKNPEFLAKDVVRYFRENPELLLINRNSKKKAIEEG